MKKPATAPASPAGNGWVLLHVDPALIAPHPDNPRGEVGDVSELAASIATVGVLEPLVVTPVQDAEHSPALEAALAAGHDFLAIAGHRRLAASKQAGATTVPVLVRPDLSTRALQVEAMLIENLQRVDLTPVEEADAYQLVMDLEGLSQKELAAAVGQPVSRVRERLRLTKASDVVRAKIQARQVTLAEGLALAEFDNDPAVQKKLAAAAGTEDFAWKIRQAREARRVAKERAARVRSLSAAGMQVQKKCPDGAKDLGVLMPDFPGYADEARRVETAIAIHGSCPGRVAWEGAGGWLTFGCTQPDLHPRASRPARSEEDVAAAAAAAAEKARAQAEADVDTAVRLERIREVVDGDRTPAVLRSRALALVNRALGLGADHDNVRGGLRGDLSSAAVFLDLVGAKVPDEAGDPSLHPDRVAAIEAAVSTVVGAAPIDQLLILVDLATNADSETTLRQGTPFLGDQDAAWFAALRDYGHAFTPTERARYTWRSWEGQEAGYVTYNVDGPVGPETPAVDDEEATA